MWKRTVSGNGGDRVSRWAMCGILLASIPAGAQITATQPMPAVVTVHVTTPSTKQVIADTIFGSFLEPIGNSINNGISAEILVNRGLEGGLWNHVNLENLYKEQPELVESSNNTGIPVPWQSMNTAAGNRFELHVGDAANSWQSLEILGQPDELTGIMQKVYLPVQRVLGYKVSFYAKHVSGPTGVTVSFRDRETGKVLVEAKVDAPAMAWTKYSAVLQLSPGAVKRLQAVNFAVAVEGAERVDVDQFSLMPGDAIGGLDPDAVAMAKAMNITELRLGGNFSSYYHWKDGIGPEDKRPTMENIAWGIPEYNNFGTDEFLQLCQLIHAIPQFDLNMGSGTPEEAVEWVRYIKAHYHGHVIYELGNELFGKWQVGYPTLAEIAPRTLAFSKAVHAVDPDAMLIATGLGPVDGEAWNTAQLSNPAGTFDDLSVHFILGTNHPAKQPASPDFTAAAAYALPFAVGPHFDEIHALMEQHGSNAHLAVTEWLFNSRGFGERNFTDESPSWINEGGAVMAAGFLNTVLRHSSQIDLTDMTGLMEFAGIWKRREQVYAVPAYYAFQLYTQVKGDTVLATTTDSGSYSAQGGVPPFLKMDDVPYVDVVATRSADGKILTLLCVNRSLERDADTNFDLGGIRIAKKAKLQQIKADTRYEQNDEIEPNHVVPVTSTVTVADRGSLRLTLPRESVSVVRLRIK